MYSRVWRGTLRLSSEHCGCIWLAWVGSYWPSIIFYCVESPTVSSIMGQGHVCVSFSDVLTIHQMTDVLEMETMASVKMSGRTEQLPKAPLGFNIPSSYTTGRVQTRTTDKLILSVLTALNFEFISNNFSHISKVNRPKSNTTGGQCDLCSVHTVASERFQTPLSQSFSILYYWQYILYC